MKIINEANIDDEKMKVLTQVIKSENFKHNMKAIVFENFNEDFLMTIYINSFFNYCILTKHLIDCLNRDESAKHALVESIYNSIKILELRFAKLYEK